MRYAGLIKFLLLIFMAIAIYNYDKTKIKSIIRNASEKISEISSIIKDEEQLEAIDDSNIKIGTEKDSSYIEKKLSNAIRKALKTPEGKAIVEKVVNKLSSEKPKIQQLLSNNYSIEEINVGSGYDAKCGQKIKISHFTKPIKKNEEKNTSPDKINETITLGEGVLPKSLEQAIIGMKKNGTRHITFSNGKIDFLSKKNTSFFYYSDVTLLETFPQNVKKLNKQVFTKNTNSHNADALKFHCGDDIFVHYTISDLNNKILYDSRTNNLAPKALKIGSIDTPHEITMTLDNLPITHQLFITTSSKDLPLFNFINQPNNINITEETILLSLYPSLSK